MEAGSYVLVSLPDLDNCGDEGLRELVLELDRLLFGDGSDYPQRDGLRVTSPAKRYLALQRMRRACR